MTALYRYIAAATPYALLWVWQVNIVPDMDTWSFTALVLLFLLNEFRAYYSGVRRGLLIGHVIVTKIVADMKKILSE